VDPDSELVDQARAGNQEAFADLVRRYQVRIFNLARVSTRNDADAEDVAQEIFIRVHRGLRAFRGDSAFRTWLYRIAVNVTRTQAGRPSLFGWFRRVEPDEAGGADPLEALPGRDAVEDSVGYRDAIDHALGRLTPDLRMAVTLRDIEGLEYREIAEVLDVPIGTVMSRISRGREKLRPILARALGWGGGASRLSGRAE
jgi:RNA polymerase sigma-70 factor (ECF subfamily)